MNQTIYFRKHVWKYLVNEQDKSALVNSLLEDYYRINVNIKVNEDATLSSQNQDLVSKVFAPKPIPKVFEPKFCKNGHPIPYPRDKCLGKGCKYS